eukprot:scaffold3987_cov118-Isochrysis_galbana.AAC.5
MTDPPTNDTEAREQDAPGTNGAKQRAPVHGHTGDVPPDKALSDTERIGFREGCAVRVRRRCLRIPSRWVLGCCAVLERAILLFVVLHRGLDVGERRCLPTGARRVRNPHRSFSSALTHPRQTLKVNKPIGHHHHHLGPINMKKI